ncbi:MAG: hypothetical protein DI582_05750 [Azospirillum brasilense]|nr:MAG: hypothetical protein DI582_05750 [Azospirillum brasilense]
MAQTYVVGDSVALGIGQQIQNARIVAREGARIDQMEPFFNSAIAGVSQGDTVIISAGYNSTGANGLSTQDVSRLQGWVDQLHAKGAKVVIAPLREEGMGGAYAHLNGKTAQTNQQLRSLRNATVADGCVATANGIAGGEIHGAYGDLARICQTSAGAALAATSGRDAAGETDEQRQTRERNARTAEDAQGQGSGGGFMEMIMGLFSKIGDLIKGLFSWIGGLFGGGNDDAPQAAAAAPAATAQAPQRAAAPAQPSISPEVGAQATAAVAASSRLTASDLGLADMPTPAPAPSVASATPALAVAR